VRDVCNATHCLGDRWRLILRQRVRCSARAVRAVWNTWVFQTETRVVADVVLVINTPELSARVLINGNFPTRLNEAGCQQVVQRVHLQIHIRLLLLQFDNSILLKSCIQQPLICVCMCCSLWYRLYLNPCFLFNLLYFCLYRQSIALLWGHVSAQCLDYPICETKDCWHCIDGYFRGGITYMSCTVSVEEATITSHINYCHNATLRLAKIQDQ